MKRHHRPLIAPMILCGLLAGCVTGNVLYVPGDLSRTGTPPSSAAGPPAVAVLDFSFAGSPSGDIGRDFDHVRSIVWEGDPGKAMADLVASALAEKGIAAVRAAGEADLPAGVPAKVSGSVEDFHVDVKRIGMIKVEAEAVVTLKIRGAGPNAPQGWTGKVSSTYWNTDPVVTPGGVRDALAGAAEAVAGEAAQRLLEAGVVSIPK